MYGKVWEAKDGIQNCFKQIAKDILSDGLISSPRGKETKQCIGATVIMDPYDTMIRNKARKMNYIFSLVEKLVYTSGNGLYAGILDWYNSNYSYYEDGIDIGNYCWRIMPQIRKVVNTLNKDRDSRQAIISIYNNLYDQRQTKDVPCTLSLQFLIRDDKLDMIATMRSNDLLWGFSYDINQFAYIQKLIAMFLDIGTGCYIHHSNSLHIYDYSYKTFEQIIACDQVVDAEDLIPVYNGDLQRRLNSYFLDLQRFWKLQSMLRFNPSTQSMWNASNFINFNQQTPFFTVRISRVTEYNRKKIKDYNHLQKYFKVCE